MNKNIGIIIGLVVVAGIGFFALSGGKTETQNTVTEVQKEVVTNEVITPKQPNTQAVATNEVKTPEQPNTQEAVKSGAGSYEAYSPQKIAMAETRDVVLFFHASWCPSCRALNGDIEKNVGAIPAGVTILKTDYDKETELKKKYGVTTQHTLVQVDKDGNLIKKWSGGSKLENLISQVQ